LRGETGHQVPVLLNKEEVLGIQALIQYRGNVGVIASNLNVFAAPTRGSKKFLCGNDCMRKVLQYIPDLEAPERIHSTELRKVCVTVSQIADLSNNDL